MPLGNISISKPWLRVRAYLYAPSFVIAGTGRCGSMAIARALSACGLSCGHEWFFNPWVARHLDPGQSGRLARSLPGPGDASWLAVPFLRRIDRPILHQVRHPIDVINSFHGIRFFDQTHRPDNPFRRFAEQHFSLSGAPLEDCMRWYVDWNRRISPHTALRFRTEDLGPELLHDILDLLAAPAACHDRLRAGYAKIEVHNTKAKLIAPVTRLPSGPLRDEVASLAADYGYDMP